MGKRVIRECDLTKQELADDDEIVTIVIKRTGKKTGRTYELSSESAAKLEKQLVAGREAILDPNWGFGSVAPTRATENKPGRVTLGDLDAEDDSHFVSSKKAELKEQGIIEEDRELPTNSTIMDVDAGGCMHINKGPIQTTLKNKKRFIYRVCRECGRHVQEKKVEEKTNYFNAELPKDISMRDISDSRS